MSKPANAAARTTIWVFESSRVIPFNPCMNSMRDVVQSVFADEKARGASSRTFSEEDQGIFLRLPSLTRISQQARHDLYTNLYIQKKKRQFCSDCVDYDLAG